MTLQLFTPAEEEKIQLCALGSKIKLKEFQNVRVSTADRKKRDANAYQNQRSSVNLLPRLYLGCKAQSSFEKTPGNFPTKVPISITKYKNIPKFTSQRLLNQSNSNKSSEIRNSPIKLNQKINVAENIIKVLQITLNKQAVLKSYMQKFHSIIRDRGKELFKIKYVINEKYNHIQKSRVRSREIIDSECARIYREDIEIKNFKDFIYDETINKKYTIKLVNKIIRSFEKRLRMIQEIDNSTYNTYNTFKVLGMKMYFSQLCYLNLLINALLQERILNIQIIMELIIGYSKAMFLSYFKKIFEMNFLDTLGVFMYQTIDIDHIKQIKMNGYEIILNFLKKSNFRASLQINKFGNNKRKRSAMSLDFNHYLPKEEYETMN